MAGDGEEVTRLLQEVLERLDRLERRVDALAASGRREGAAAIATAVDAFDEAAARLQARGVDPDAHLAAALRLLEGLTDPEAAAALTRIAGRLEALDGATAALEAMPGAIAAGVDLLDAWAQEPPGGGAATDARLRRLLRALDRFTQAEVLEAVEALAEELPRLARWSRSAAGALAAVVDTFDSWATQAAERGLDPEMLFERLVRTLEAGGRSLLAPAPPVGLFGAMRATKKPEVRRALGVAVALAEGLGRVLEEAPASQTRYLEPATERDGSP